VSRAACFRTLARAAAAAVWLSLGPLVALAGDAPRTAPATIDPPAAFTPPVFDSLPATPNLERLDGQPIESGAAYARIAEPAKTTDQPIHIHGRLAYRRPDGVLEGVDNAFVWVWDDDPTPDVCIDAWFGYFTTDQNGYFDVTVTYPSRDPWCDTTPDIKLVWGWSGGDFTHAYISGLGEDHALVTPTIVDFTGSDIDYGTIGPIAPEAVRRTHHFQVIRRVERWVAAHGYPILIPERLPLIAGVDEGTPVDVPTRYNHSYVAGYAGSLLLASGDTWNDSRLARIVAESWLDQYGAYDWTEDLCNGTCDGTSAYCDYCTWCAESPVTAWQKGLEEWMAEQALSDNTLGYEVPALNVVHYESVGACGGAPVNPYLISGYFAACLHDMSDTVDEDDPLFPQGRDAMGWGPDFALQIAVEDHPASVGAFFADFRARYPAACEQMWLTAANVGYSLDGLPPNAITGLASSSHTPGVASTNARVTLNWTEPADDCFDSKQYSMVIASTAQAPDNTAEIGDVSTWTTAPLAAGTWYITLRVGDLAGNWRTDYATFGPVVIVNPTPANLANVAHTGWAAPVVPRASSDATLSNVAAPATLPGNATGTYWNVSVQNTGGASTGSGSGSWVQADGVGFYSPINPPEYAVSVPTLAGGQAWQAVNLGPLYLRGGRHTFGSYCDFTGLVAESNETDNAWARQWTWTPYSLALNGSTYRLSPPDRTGGWDSATGTLYYNCDGVRFTSSGWWNALTVYASNNDADFDARLHVASTGANDGFGAYSGWSSRPAGYLDAVFVNRNRTGTSTTNWDVGVIQGTDVHDLSSYQAQHITSVEQSVGDSITVTLGVGEAMAIREVYVPAGWHSAIVRLVSGQGPLHLSWLPADFVTGDMDDYGDTATDDGTGTSRIEFDPASSDYNAFAVYRDRFDTDYTQPVTFTFQVIATPPDLRPLHPAGWADAIVPRPANDGTPGSVPAPASLTGWTASTWLNWATINDSPMPASTPVANRILRDGTTVLDQIEPSYPAGGSVLTNYAYPVTVPGGRHTLSLHADQPDAVLEISETNNRTAAQYAWSPQLLARGTTTGLPHPADPEGGWPDLPAGPYWPNCDGYRTPTFEPGVLDGQWAAVAALAAAPGGVDLRLHDVSDDPTSAFTATLATSELPNASTDFVAIDLGNSNAMTFDVGVTHSLGTEPVQLSVVSSTALGSQPTGEHGPYTMPAGEAIALYDLKLYGAPYRVRLVNLSTDVNLDLTLLPPDGVVFGPLDVPAAQRSATGSLGENEEVLLPTPTAGSWCAVVTRAGNADLGNPADYRLDFMNMTDVPDDGPLVPGATLAASPNPFAPVTSLSFGLAMAGPVDLEVFDLGGRRVRRLAGGRYSAGRHSVSWDGRDEEGREVASGVYVVRFAAEGRHEVLKLARMR